VSARILLIVGAVVFAAACGAQSSGSASGTGLFGTVRNSPSSPTCRFGAPCTRPARGFRLVFVRNGRTAATATTDRHGRYRVRLDRGRYLVRPARGGTQPKRGLAPAKVNVPGDRYAKRDFTYDTGIR
jgi:hypothetical protein